MRIGDFGDQKGVPRLRVVCIGNYGAAYKLDIATPCHQLLYQKWTRMAPILMMNLIIMSLISSVSTGWLKRKWRSKCPSPGLPSRRTVTSLLPGRSGGGCQGTHTLARAHTHCETFTGSVSDDQNWNAERRTATFQLLTNTNGTLKPKLQPANLRVN